MVALVKPSFTIEYCEYFCKENHMVRYYGNTFNSLVMDMFNGNTVVFLIPLCNVNTVYIANYSIVTYCVWWMMSNEKNMFGFYCGLFWTFTSFMIMFHGTEFFKYAWNANTP